MNFSKKLSKPMNSSSWNKEYRKLFIIGCIIGAACFAFIYGVRILDFTYDDWLLNGDMDLKQHYIGFCHYRMSAWHFPIGLIDTLSFPNSMSVIYTDSIPIFAVLFKLFNYVLPVRFQYFGLFGLLSFMLMGGLSTILLRRFCSSRIICIIGSVFFIVSYPVIQRLYYHTALAAQWIIILAFVLWFYQEKFSVRKRTIVWGFMGFLCVGIHSYFLPMCGMILAASIVDSYVAKRHESKRSLKLVMINLLPLISFCLAAIANLYILGGFYGSSNAEGLGLGTFNSNLNTFVNPLSDGRLYNELPMYTDFQYEGFAYLGGGILFLLAAALIISLISIISKKWSFGVLLKNHRLVISGALFLVSFMTAVLPMVTINDRKIIGVPYPQFVYKVMSIFRSNGRLIWPAMYLLILLAIAFFAKLCDRYSDSGQSKLRIFTEAFILIALALQLFDISGMLKGKSEYFKVEQIHDNVWYAKELQDVISDRSGFVFMYNENDIIMDTAYYGYLNNMWQNNYYYARDINSEIDEDINLWKHEVQNGIIRDDIVYLFRNEDYNPDLYKGLELYPVGGNIAGIKPKTAF